MAASGSGRGASGSRSFDFGSDDVLCAYDDFSAHEPKRPDPSEKEFHDSRMGRPFVKIYEQENYSKEDVLSAVEKCMKKYADNLLRSLEGIGSRLSQLEIYCYKLERSIGEFRSDMIRGQSETDLKLKSLEKHLHEVHRSVQILRDKQELADTQKELAKLQFVQDSSKKNEESVTSSPKKLADKPDPSSQQLALVLPHQVNAAPLPPRASEQVQLYKDQTAQQPVPTSLGTQQDRFPTSLGTQQDQYVLSQAIVYYPQRQALAQDSQAQPVQPEVRYMQARPPVQDLPVQAPSQQPQIVNQALQSYPTYQQQWHPQSSQQLPAPVAQPQPTFSQPFPAQSVQTQQSNTQQFPQQSVQPQQPNPQQLPPQQMQPRHPSMQAQMRPQTAPSYPPYPPRQPVNPSSETIPGSMPMQGPYTTVPPSGVNRPEVVPFAYGGSGVPASQPPMQHMQRQQPPPSSQGSFGPPLSQGGYVGSAHYAPQVNPQGYNTGYSYPPSGVSGVQTQQVPPSGSVGMSHLGSHPMRGHPYGEMIEKAVSMGYPRDQVLSVTQRIAESGQPVDFNALLDRLNEPGSGAPPRAW